MSKKVIIIGGGVAGLSTGCYLRMNGYDTEIHEMHTLPGGLCTAWKRQGYTVDGCIHWLVGTSPDDPYYRLWNELVDMKGIHFVQGEVFYRLEDPTGRQINVFTDIDRFEKELLEKAPQDKKVTKEFVRAARALLGFEMPVDKPSELYSVLDMGKLMMQYLPHARLFRKWMNITGGQFAARCKDPLLRRMFETMFFPEMSALFLVFMLVWMHKKSAGYPVGGSLDFARRMEKRYIELGGTIHYASKVAHVIVEKGAAVGVMLESGEDRSADIVISAADGHCTIYEMLGGRFVDEKIEAYYREYPIFPSWVQVSLGVARIFEGYPGMVGYMLEEPILIDESTKSRSIHARIFNFDPTMSPPGKTIVTCLLPTANYEYWQKLREHDPEDYKAQKKRITDAVIDVLERKIGGIGNCVEMVDVSTPATVARYTNNWKGSLEGWVLGPKMGLRRMSKTLPGLENFYMAGQWVEPGGGLPTALISGRNVAQLICRKDKRKFTTESY